MAHLNSKPLPSSCCRGTRVRPKPISPCEIKFGIVCPGKEDGPVNDRSVLGGCGIAALQDKDNK
jgi:hypothetical protein